MALIRNFSDAFWQMDKPGLKVDLRKPDVKREIRLYWREGNKDNPAGVIKYLESRGGKNTQGFKGDDVQAVYFIGRSGHIEKTNNEDLKWIIMQSSNK